MKTEWNRMRILSTGLVLAAGVATLGPPAAQAEPGPEAQTRSSARVYVYNRTDCAFEYLDKGIDRGEWTTAPPATILKGRYGYARTASTDDQGTSAWVSYTARNCGKKHSSLEGKHLRFSWDVEPGVGNSCDTQTGTDPAFHTNYHCPGGNHPRLRGRYMPSN